MKRAALALLATVAGLMFIFSYRPVTVAADPATIIIAAPPYPEKPYPKKGGKRVVDYDLAGQGLDLAGLPDGRHAGAVVEIAGGHGPLQVTVAIVNGAVVDLASAHRPTSAHSAQISGRALPLLREEVLTTQQVPVDAVSGATAVSQAFAESLLSLTGSP